MSDTLKTANAEFQKAFDFLAKELSNLQTGRASAGLVEDIMVESYGNKTPLKHVANISLPSAQEIFIDPWDKSQLTAIEKAIRDHANLGLSPINNGVSIRLNVPPLTEERRKEMTKIVHQKAEHAKVVVRQSRHNAMDTLKKEEKDGAIGEDDLRHFEKKLQKKVDEANKHIEEMSTHKEAEVMKI